MTYNALIESLKRLYRSDKITQNQVQERLDKGTISQDEYDYIVS